MNKADKKYELLSAFLDDELNNIQAEELKEKLKNSPELKKKLEELKRTKNLTSSIKRLPESHFFETKLMAKIHSEKPSINKFKKWYPALSFAFLAVALMVVLKLNPNMIHNIVEQQKINISDFYKTNLKPLLYAADLSNEDIFNFAFSRKLPLDNKNHQYLQLGADSNGTDFFEIKTAGLNEAKENNLEKFAGSLKMNNEQRRQMDSILESYADDIQTQVLVNEKNTLAINQNFWNYNKALAADLLSFAEKVNKSELNKILSKEYSFADNRSIAHLVNEVKTSDNNKYIFFTPDSIFSEQLEIDKGKMKEELKRMKKELRNLPEEISKAGVYITLDNNLAKLQKDSSWNKNFKVYFDTNSCSVHLSNIVIPKIQLPNFDRIATQIEEATKNIQSFSFNFPKELKNGKGNFHFKIESGDSAEALNFDIQIPNVDSLIKLNKEFADTAFILNGRNLNIPPDSLASTFKFFFSDSGKGINPKMLQRQMKEFKKEMEKFRKEMEKLKKNIKNNNREIENHTIEI